MAKNRTIAFDFDDVILPVNSRIYNILTDLGVEMLPYSEIQWGFKNFSKEVQDFAQTLYGRPEFMHKIEDSKRVDYFKNLFSELQEKGYNVIIVSSVYESCMVDRIKFINEHFLVPYIFTDDKSKIEVDILIEDSAQNAYNSSSNAQILLNSPWNKNRDVKPTTHRVEEYDKIGAKIYEIIRKKESGY